MYFSPREQNFLKVMIDYPEGVTVQKFQDLFNLSKRTVYREISSIEKSLKFLDIQVEKPRGEGYQLIGQQSNIDRLSEYLMAEQLEVFEDNVDRQSAITATLLLMDEEYKIDSLAVDFQVSSTTIKTDLKSIEKSLTDFGLELQRNKGRGIKISGLEKGRRQLLGNLIFNGINEYDFFNVLNSKEDNHFRMNDNFFFNLIDNEYLFLANHLLFSIDNVYSKKITDNQLQYILIVLCISLQRIKSHQLIDSEFKEKSVKPDTMQISSQILMRVAKLWDISIPPQEVRFLASQFEGINYKKNQTIFIDNFDVELSYKVKELIRLVSKDTNINFQTDERLFNDLLTHMSSALQRIFSSMQDSDRPLLKKIRDKYQKLTVVIEKQLMTVFPEHLFSNDELGYVIIHFATSYERNPNRSSLSVLVICSSGIGTSRILESRIKKYLPEFENIYISKLSEMANIEYKTYDLILSTIFLPGFTLDYKVISPLLLDEEIQEIKAIIGNIETSDTTVATPKTFNEEPISFKEMYEEVCVANKLLQSFVLRKIPVSNTIEDTIKNILLTIGDNYLVDVDEVLNYVIERYKVAPIGIPDSNIALFHSANSNIKQPFFAIYELNTPFEIEGMNRKKIQMNRVLLLLAPDPMAKSEEKLLGKISSSVIESDLNLEIYKYGNEKMIHELLSSLFVKEIKEK